MKETQPGMRSNGVTDGLHRIVLTSISIFDSAIKTLLGEQSSDSRGIRSSGYVECMRNVFSSLGIGEAEDEVLTREVFSELNQDVFPTNMMSPYARRSLI